MANLRDALYTEEDASLTQPSGGFVDSSSIKLDRNEVLKRTEINPALGGLRGFTAIPRPSEEQIDKSEVKKKIHEKVEQFVDQVVQDKNADKSPAELQAIYPQEIKRLGEEIGKELSVITDGILDSNKSTFDVVVKTFLDSHIQKEIDKQVPEENVDVDIPKFEKAEVVRISEPLDISEIKGQEEGEVIPDSPVIEPPNVEGEVTSDSPVSDIERQEEDLTVNDSPIIEVPEFDGENTDILPPSEDQGLVGITSESSDIPKIEQLNSDIVDTWNESISSMGDTFVNYGKSFVENITDGDKWTDATLGGLYDIASSVMSSFAGAVDSIMTDNYVMKSIMDLPSFAGSLLDAAVYDPINDMVNRTIGNAANLVNQAANGISAIVNWGTDWVADEINIGADIANDFLVDVAKKVNNFFFDLIRGKGDAFYPQVRFDSVREDGDTFHPRTRTQPPMTNATKMQVSRDVYGLATNKKNDNFYVGPLGGLYGNLQLSNEMYWTISIRPYDSRTGNTPPSLSAFFFGSETDYNKLPIVSFDLVGESAGSQELDLYPGMSLVFPSQLNRPSRLTVTFPEFIRDISGKNQDYSSCLTDFKDAYVRYTFLGAKDAMSTSQEIGTGSYSQAVRDFRECSYIIDITKYAMNWVPARRWRYLGVPEVSTMVRGSSQSSVEMSELQFTLVGEYFDESTG